MTPCPNPGSQNPPEAPVSAIFVPTNAVLEYPSPEDVGGGEGRGGGDTCDGKTMSWPRPVSCPPMQPLSPSADFSSARLEGGGEWGGDGGVGSEGSLRVAVVVAGQLFRFSWKSLYEGVIKSNVDAGHHVVRLSRTCLYMRVHVLVYESTRACLAPSIGFGLFIQRALADTYARPCVRPLSHIP
jgi:hypothetical protein